MAINLDCVASGNRLLVTTLPQHRWVLKALPPSACIEEKPVQLLDAAKGDAHAFRAAMIPALLIYERDSYPIMHTPTTDLKGSTIPLPRSAQESSP